MEGFEFRRDCHITHVVSHDEGVDDQTLRGVAFQGLEEYEGRAGRGYFAKECSRSCSSTGREINDGGSESGSASVALIKICHWA